MRWFILHEQSNFSKKEYQEYKRGVPQHYNVGDHLICSEAEGVCDKIEWSITFQTWCYHVTGKAPYWIYQTDETLHKFGKRPLRVPRVLPDPIPIME